MTAVTRADPAAYNRPAMRTSSLKADLLLLLTALIWGSAFVAQRTGMEAMGPLLFTAARFALGALVLLPLVLLREGLPDRATLRAGAVLGAVLFAGAALQQAGLVETTAGKAGFITGLYVVMVPLLGLALGQRAGVAIWVGAGLAVAGLWLVSVTGPLRLAPGDGTVLAGALFWALHVVLVGRFAARLPPLALALVQFVACAVLALAAAVALEPVAPHQLVDGGWALLYAGVLSVGLGFTFQVVAQRDALASHAAILLSLEAVFAALAGWLFLDEVLTARQLYGCGLMLAGMLLAQLAPLAGRRRPVTGLPQGDHPA